MKLIPVSTSFLAEITQFRRDIHAHPELAFQELRTAEQIQQQLSAWDIPHSINIASTGIVASIKKGNSERAIALRADMDALPLQELNQFAHASKHQGKMHACGHDGHTAMLLGAAHYLQYHATFDGIVHLIFQPAEEGGGGAKKMIDEGLFEQFPCEAVFGMHNWPGLKEGQFALREGPMMASSNEFKLEIKGKGAHAAQPQNAIDPVIVAVQIAQSWQTIVSRNTNPVDASVLSVTQIHTGSATNLIPDTAQMIGTVRTFTTSNLDLIEKRMQEIALHTAAAFGAEATFTFKRNYPPLINHKKETAFALNVITQLVGKSNVIPDVEPTMGAEDFAFMLKEKAGCYVFLGNGAGDHRSSGHGLGPCNLHNPSYDFNDNLIHLGMSYWINLVESYLTIKAAAN
jgi:amidohydrolase